jgi:glycosyltransferase involved in cell wall biosynthesis
MASLLSRLRHRGDAPICAVVRDVGHYHHVRFQAFAGIRSAAIAVVEVVNRGTFTPFNRAVAGDEEYRRLTLFPGEAIENIGTRVLRGHLRRQLDAICPAVTCVNGWSSPEALATLEWCVDRGTPAVLMSESTVLDKRRPFLADSVKRRLLRLYSAALAGGSRPIQYLRRLGFPETAVFPGYDVVDNAHFHRFQPRDEAGPAARRSLLVCCRFVPVKNLPRLLGAYARYRQAAGSPAWELVIAGDGPEREKLSGLITALHLNGSVRLAGFVQYDGLPALYARAGAFILPSVSEPWGLVVNEAMAAGLPVLVSKRCGCAPDLVEEGRNGFTFDPYDTEQLAGLMLRLSTMSDAERAAMGQASRQIISRWTPETFATNLSKAVEVALAAPRPKATLLDKALLWALIHRPHAV